MEIPESGEWSGKKLDGRIVAWEGRGGLCDDELGVNGNDAPREGRVYTREGIRARVGN